MLSSGRFLKLILVVIVSIVLEIGFFNFPVIKLFLDTEISKNEAYTLMDFEKINWEEKSGIYISGQDPMLILDNLNNMYLANIGIHTDMQIPLSSITVFYTNSEVAAFSGDDMFFLNGPIEKDLVLPINKNVSSLRIDLGEEAGTQLGEAKFILNEAKFDIRISRIVTVILIYVVGSFLLKLQRPREYDI